MSKLFILGLDSIPPYVLYEGVDGGGFNYLRGLVGESRKYVLKSCHPPITVPAWMVLFTGKTPGELGLYGFRHRRAGEFEPYIVSSKSVKEPTLWDIAGKKKLRSIVFGVPPTYPPKPINGYLVTDFTTPNPEKTYTWPPWLKKELEQRFGRMVFDIVYRSHDKDRVAKDLFHMLDQHLKVMEYLVTTKTWDIVVYVEIAVDRAHHAFWKYFDKRHPRYQEHNVYSKIIPEVYRRIDQWFEKLHKKLPKDTVIVIASDHGVKPMKGSFTINQWLIEQGYLKLREKPSKPGTDLREDMIDWQHTIAWAWGGYYSRVFINLKGREKHGIVEPKYYEETVKQLKKDIEKIRGPNGERWDNKVYTPQELYPVARGDPPDLMVYLDNLSWRPAGTIGWPSNYLPENDRGPDDAVHDWYGVFTIYDPEGRVKRGYGGTIDIHEAFKLLIDLLSKA